MQSISEFNKFLLRITDKLALELSAKDLLKEYKDEYELAAVILGEINKFFYQRHSSLDKRYISEFHKYWAKNAKNVLDPKINKGICYKVAKVLEDVYKNNIIRVQLDTLDLRPKEIANVRFFTAIQDFKIDINVKINPFELFKKIPECFNAKEIIKNELLVDKFLNEIGAESQRDKRKPWMIEAAKLLVDRFNGSAFNINKELSYDVKQIKDLLAGNIGYGFSQKKADMFLRDMADLGVWRYKKNIEFINVMSDKNTMRVALRTGILQFRIPLLASYLDVYCYQYELVDEWTSLAWRTVWKEWSKIKNNHRPLTPASIDYFIYKLGKLACWKSSNRRRCLPNNPVKDKWLQSQLKQDRLLFDKDKYCIFNKICGTNKKGLNHPMSISQRGQTGWDSGAINEGGGGGIQS